MLYFKVVATSAVDVVSTCGVDVVGRAPTFFQLQVVAIVSTVSGFLATYIGAICFNVICSPLSL